MGQGTESCGGYELEYDPFDYDSSCGYTEWNGEKLSRMSKRHIENCIRFCKRKAFTASYTDDQHQWNDWIDALEVELNSRPEIKKALKHTKPTKPQSGLKQSMICHCGQEYEARVADIKRGWALSCSKSCASIRRTYKKKPAKQKELGK